MPEHVITLCDYCLHRLVNDCNQCSFNLIPRPDCMSFAPRADDPNVRILAELATIKAELARLRKIAFWGGPGNVPLGGGG